MKMWDIIDINAIMGKTQSTRLFQVFSLNVCEFNHLGLSTTQSCLFLRCRCV